ncbi:MAG: XRE family transcriptional regulator [Cyanobacteriota bacterium]
MSSTRLQQITLQPQVLRWARERAGLDPETLARKVKVTPETVLEWEQSGEIGLKQVDKLAQSAHIPLGFLYLPEPIQDELSIPDFRTVNDQSVPSPSPDLIETVQLMQRRQDWLREEMIEQGQEKCSLAGSIKLGTPPEQAAAGLRESLGLESDWAESRSSWTDALAYLRDVIEAAGVVVVFNGVVGNNTHRKLDPSEFRGFALADSYAPLIFVNGADAKAAQLFTLVHELAHICIQESGVSNLDALQPLSHDVELSCNAIAAEFLVPAHKLQELWSDRPVSEDPYQWLARRFRVSSIVAARRALDLGLITKDDFFQFYQSWQENEKSNMLNRPSGGSFWNNQNVRIGNLFGTAVIRAVREGRLTYREAYSLTNLKSKSFDQFVEKIEARG